MESASAEGENEVNAELVVDGISAERFLTAFTWDEAKHPARRPLRETMERLQESVAKIEDDFRVKTGDWRQLKHSLAHCLEKRREVWLHVTWARLFRTQMYVRSFPTFDFLLRMILTQPHLSS